MLLYSGLLLTSSTTGAEFEFEFVQITVPPNEMLAQITERMPLLLADEDTGLWLGEDRAPVEEVMALIRTRELGSDWETEIEDPTKKPPRPRRPKSTRPPSAPEPDLFA